MLPGRVDFEGRIYLTTQPIGAAATYRGGFPLSPLGAIYASAADPHHYQNGFGVTIDGRLCYGTVLPVDYYKDGLPRKNNGRLLLEDGNAVASDQDPFVGGLRIVAATGALFAVFTDPPIGEAPVLVVP